MVFMCKIGIKYQYIGQAMYAHIHMLFGNEQGALIGACALIRMNMVSAIFMYIEVQKRTQNF